MKAGRCVEADEVVRAPEAFKLYCVVDDQKKYNWAFEPKKI